MTAPTKKSAEAEIIIMSLDVKDPRPKFSGLLPYGLEKPRNPMQIMGKRDRKSVQQAPKRRRSLVTSWE